MPPTSQSCDRCKLHWSQLGNDRLIITANGKRMTIHLKCRKKGDKILDTDHKVNVMRPSKEYATAGGNDEPNE